jgi:hypothetical protein
MKQFFVTIVSYIPRPHGSVHGVSLRRAYWHWYLLLIVSSLVGILLMSVAGVLFRNATGDTEVAPAESTLVRYRAQDVAVALERYEVLQRMYDADMKAHNSMNDTSVSTSTPATTPATKTAIPKGVSSHTSKPPFEAATSVATTTTPEVE